MTNILNALSNRHLTNTYVFPYLTKNMNANYINHTNKYYFPARLRGQRQRLSERGGRGSGEASEQLLPLPHAVPGHRPLPRQTR